MPIRPDVPDGTDGWRSDVEIPDWLRQQYDDLLANMQRPEYREAVTRALAATSEEMGRAAVEGAEIEQAMRQIRNETIRSGAPRMSDANLLAAARAAVEERRAKAPRPADSP